MASDHVQAAGLRVSSLGIKVTVGDYEVTGVTDIPDMGANPEKLDVTSLADDSRKYINGIKDYGDLEFGLLYESGAEGNYAKLAAFEGQSKECVVTFRDGSTFTFTGKIALKVNAVGVNAVVTFAMTVALESDIAYNGGNLEVPKE